MAAGCEDDSFLAGQWISYHDRMTAPDNAIAIGHTDSLFLELYDDGRGYLTGHIEGQGIYDNNIILEPVHGFHKGDDVTLRFDWGIHNRACVGYGRWRVGDGLAWHLDVNCSNGFWFVEIGNAFHGLHVTAEKDYGDNYYPADPLFDVPADSIWRQDGSPTCTAFERVPTANLTKLRRLHIVTYREALESSPRLLGFEETNAISYDPDNQTMVRESVADERGDKDAFEWEPTHNKRWFAERIIEVKKRHGLSVDSRERAALARMLASGNDEIDCGDD